jgi:hypothetical protein
MRIHQIPVFDEFDVVVASGFIEGIEVEGDKVRLSANGDVAVTMEQET